MLCYCLSCAFVTCALKNYLLRITYSSKCQLIFDGGWEKYNFMFCYQINVNLSVFQSKKN